MPSRFWQRAPALRLYQKALEKGGPSSPSEKGSRRARISRRVRELRDAAGFTLDALAERSGVSRSNISLIERGQSSPTAAVLDKLAAGLGVTVASLFEDDALPAAEPSPMACVAEQPRVDHPASGRVRPNLSPAARSPIQLVEVVFPTGQRVA